MARIAIIENGIVSNVIEADSEQIAADLTGMLCVLATDAGIGWFYNEESNDFSAPPTPQEPEILPPIVAENIEFVSEPKLISRPTEE